MRPDPGFWRGKRVLLTGHTGFKGAWLALWLQRLGAQVSGVAQPPATRPDLFTLARVAQGMESHFCDLLHARALAARVRAARPEVVLHLAAQALVRASYTAPVQTFARNVMGTVHLLDALRGLAGVRVAVVVTSDKVYRNREWAYPYREDDALGGHDPYSASKAAAELVTASYRDAFLAGQGTAVASARCGNAIGGGDWAPERLLPDAVRAWSAGQTLHLRQPRATRPWQHVLEPLAAYLRLAQRLWEQPALAGAYNFGPLPHTALSVGELIERACRAYPGSAVRHETPDGGDAAHEAGALALETAHSRQALGVAPCWDLDRAIARSMHWYRAQHGGADARALCLADITAWEEQEVPA
ncbi:CDP-glucose 4,6-dehydratase [Verminephrobacter aporrectodeae subsp. tuberculatae]|uniref:CDP-glucose 4,6-dehydratase n=1 Tax=Verminephrobacter aporrectodeae TaxID=1110389 RepID=UPI002242C8E5|nr:CDP-glucose 4,6-dehydratase [Verminephrobacter aporrectodeae]MCW8165066.1 CDP-glucose 4,6-dehydratase [Verminephrobacter aporrectodeae subsp. tuberculatae]MCW8168886.1 CDP-glucose 4,6-dehydratase [Verminephrobacter aporrectodeae subsp. tuberculatae]